MMLCTEIVLYVTLPLVCRRRPLLSRDLRVQATLDPTNSYGNIVQQKSTKVGGA